MSHDLSQPIRSEQISDIHSHPHSHKVHQLLYTGGPHFVEVGHSKNEFLQMMKIPKGIIVDFYLMLSLFLLKIKKMIN